MAALDIMVGDENGNLNLSANVTRSAFVKMAVAASPYRATVGDTTAVSPILTCPIPTGLPLMWSRCLRRLRQRLSGRHLPAQQ